MIERLYKQIVIFGSNFVNTLISLFKIIIRSKKPASSIVIENSNCLVLGNGPSLKHTLENDFNKLQSYEIICVNLFGQSLYFEKIRPRFYSLVDPIWFNYSTDTDPSHENHDRFQLLIAPTIEKFKTISWNITFLLPMHVHAKESYLVTKVLSKNPNISIIYYNYIVIEGFNWFKNIIFDKKLGSPQCQNVLATSLMQAINLGYKNIFLLGSDHSWHEDLRISDNNKLVTIDGHFYTSSSNPKYINDLKKTKTSDFFLSLHKVFRSYEVIKEYADYKNVKVYNASSKSYIDAFERKAL